MKYFTLKKLWDLRAELDNAVVTKDYDRIISIKAKYKDLVADERRFSLAFMCYNYAFWSDSQRAIHNAINIDSILENIKNYEKKYIDGEDSLLKLHIQFDT